MFQQFFLFTTVSWILASFLVLPLLVGFYFCLRKKEMVWRRDLFPLFLFELFFLISFWFRFQPYGYDELVAFTLGPLLFLLFQQKNWALFLEKHALRIAWIVAIIAGLMSFFGIILFVFEHFSRLSGIFKGTDAYSIYPNTLAFFLIMTIPFSLLALIFCHKLWWQKILAGFLFVSQLTAFFLTFSRGALIAFFLVLAVSAFLTIHFYSKTRSRFFLLKKGFFFLSLIVFIGVCSFFVNELHRHFQPAISQQVPLTEDIVARFSDHQLSADQSTDERFQFWRNSFKLMKLSPWFGVGSDGFRFQYPRFQDELLATSTHPHNLFLKIAVENGIPAAIFLLVFFAILGWGLFSKLLKEKDEKHFVWGLALFFAFLGALLHSQMDYNLNATLPWFLFWLVVSNIPLPFKVLKIRGYKVILFHITLMCGMVIFFAGSLWYGWNYRIIKQAQKSLEAGDNSNFERLISSSVFFPFQPLRYELISEYVAKAGHSATAFAYPYIVSALENYPNWPEIKIANARVLFADGKFLEAADSYEQALALNSLNDFSWHVEYIQALVKAGFFDRISEKEDFYFQLLSSYTQKLSRNEHDTVATSNPAQAYRLLLLYGSILPFEKKHDWYKLLKEYENVWQQERQKFEQLFQLYLADSSFTA